MDIILEGGEILTFKDHRNVATGQVLKSLYCNGKLVGELGRLKDAVAMIKSGKVFLYNGSVEDLIEWDRIRRE